MKRAISILAVTTALFAASSAAATEHTILTGQSRFRSLG